MLFCSATLLTRRYPFRKGSRFVHVDCILSDRLERTASCPGYAIYGHVLLIQLGEQDDTMTGVA